MLFPSLALAEKAAAPESVVRISLGLIGLPFWSRRRRAVNAGRPVVPTTESHVSLELDQLRARDQRARDNLSLTYVADLDRN